MKRTLTLVFILSLIAAVVCDSAYGQSRRGRSRTSTERGVVDSIVRNGYTLIFVNRDSSFSATTQRRMIETFFAVYPPMSERFNKNAARRVNFVIDPAYDGIAAASGQRVVYNPGWFAGNPNDIDVVTHEVMHIVQNYGNTPGPGWLTEGIADYARSKYGVDNESAGWSLPAYNARQNYTDAYRITARFLLWIESKWGEKVINSLDAAMRDHTYTDEIWTKLTGKSVQELWNEYAKTEIGGAAKASSD